MIGPDLKSLFISRHNGTLRFTTILDTTGSYPKSFLTLQHRKNRKFVHDYNSSNLFTLQKVNVLTYTIETERKCV